MCNFNCSPITPKDETWWEDMDRDADAYYESLEDDDQEEDW